MEGLTSVDKKTVLPLNNVSVQVKVKGCLVGISSTLSYYNDTSNPLEISFRFPLEESFAVVGLEAIIDGRKIKGEVQEKEKAKDMYDDAIASGLSAAYAEEKSGDIFSLSLGNLPSGSEAEISIRMVGELPIEADGQVRFTLPSVLKPRYTPVGSTNLLTGTQSVKQALVAGVFEFRMRVEGSTTVSEVSSPTHKLKIEEGAADCAVNVCIAEEGPLRGDVTILIGYKDPHEPMAIVERAVEGSKTKEMKSKAVMLNFFPKFTSIEAACEFIFVVDRSCSMGGACIKSASETLVLFLKSIPEGCYFNIVSFGSQYESFFPSSQPYNQETMEKATRFAESMQADFGGTELLAPLQSIFKQKPQSSGLPRQVFILTDGSVSNTDSVISEVRKNAHSTRCFTFGIGSGASTALVRGIAHAGNGSAEFIADNERMQSKVIRSLKKALQPSANNVAVTFEVPSNYEVKVVPEKIPSIYNGEKTVIYGLLMEISKQKGESMKCKATLTGDIIGKKFKCDIPFDLTEGGPEEADVSVIHQLAVKGMIQEWQDDEGPFKQRHKKEIVELSTDASVVSKYTAYIAVDVAQNKPVSGSMQSHELSASDKFMFATNFNVPRLPFHLMSHCGGPPPHGVLRQHGHLRVNSANSQPPSLAHSVGPQPLPGRGPPLPAPYSITKFGTKSLIGGGPPPGYSAWQPLSTLLVKDGVQQPSPMGDENVKTEVLRARGHFRVCSVSSRPPHGHFRVCSVSSRPPSLAHSSGPQPLSGRGPPLQASHSITKFRTKSLIEEGPPPGYSAWQPRSTLGVRDGVQQPSPTGDKNVKTGTSLIVSLQQANGSWLLNDQLAGVVSKSVEELKSCCPVSCDGTMVANIWATLVVVELLKKKYPSMLDELELVIMKAEQWLSKQVLPSGINLTMLKDCADKICF